MRPILLVLVCVLLGAAEPAVIVIDPSAMETCSSAPFRSSSFFVPKTQGGFDRFFAPARRHRLTRLHLLEIALAQSTSLETAIAYLERHRSALARVGAASDRLLLVVGAMPRWLSDQPQAAQVVGDAGWRRWQARPPADWERWREVITALARWLAANVPGERWYEVWNEPDLFSWQAGNDAFLRLYAETALALRAGDPNARVGGPATNQWDGGTPGTVGRPLLTEVMRHAAAQRLPLDFVSWHWFSALEADIAEPARQVRALAGELGLAPELVISEWNAPQAWRGSARAAALHADAFLSFAESRIDGQCVAAWEDFSATPQGLADYGLMTQRGELKPVWHIQACVDRMAQGGTLRHQRSGTLRILAGMDAAGRQLVLLWDAEPDPLLAAAAVLRADRDYRRIAAAYPRTDALLAAIRSPEVAQVGHRELFRQARDAMQAAERQQGRRGLIEMRFPSGWRLASADVVGPAVRPIVAVPLAAGWQLEVVVNEPILMELVR